MVLVEQLPNVIVRADRGFVLVRIHVSFLLRETRTGRVCVGAKASVRISGGLVIGYAFNGFPLPAVALHGQTALGLVLPEQKNPCSNAIMRRQIHLERA